MQDEVNTKVVAIMIKGGENLCRGAVKRLWTSSCRRLKRRRSR